MNILLFTLEYPPFKGGIANYYDNVVKHWPSPNEIFVLLNNENELINNYFWPKWLPSLYHLYVSIRAKKIDHILIGHILPLGTVAYYISKLTKTPYSVFLHGTDFSFAMRAPRKKKMALKILKSARNVICSNSYVFKLAADLLGDDKKIHLAIPGVETESPPFARGGRGVKNGWDGKIILFSLGRLVRRKGFDKVIEALPQVLQTVPNLVYIIAGSGPDENYLKDLAKSLLDHVIFLGSTTDAEKWTWLNICDIFITVSRNINGDYEGFGIVYLEAGLAGKPVIAGDSGGVRDAVVNGVTGILVDPENTDEIAKAIIKLARNENLRKSLGEEGRERVIKEFGWEEKIQKLYQIITL